MSTKRKKLLGLLGLFLVAAVTTFAAFLPPIGVAAQSVEDKITVYVSGEVPRINITSPENKATVNTPEVKVEFYYENLKRVTKVELTYTDAAGQTHTEEIKNLDDLIDDAGPTGSFTLNLDQYGGEGTYTLTIHGGNDVFGDVAEDSVEFTYRRSSSAPSTTPDDYWPGGADVTPGGDGVVKVTPHIDDDTIARVEVDVYDENGDLVEELSPENIFPPFGPLELPFAEHNLPSGKYTIELQAYSADNRKLGGPKRYDFYYNRPMNIATPDTGAPMMNLNVSKEDTMITMLTVFAIVAISAIIFVARGRKEEAAAKVKAARRSNKRR